MTASHSTIPFARHVVTAVLVAHNGERWLPQSLAACAGQTRPPHRFVAVDVAGSDSTGDILRRALGDTRVITVPSGTGFGAAVATALDAYRGAPALAGTVGGDDIIEWVWLLHDDAAPAPDALEQLLATVDDRPAIAVVGPKLRGWMDSRQLLELGVTISRSGARGVGVDRREHDQGQHDGVHDVLAVSTAGMLVRRDVWDALGGFDPCLPLFRDDIDFGWRTNLAGHRVVCTTAATFRHAEAAGSGRRPVAVAGGRAHRVDRAAALYVLLTNLPLSALPVSLIRLTIGSLVRAMGFLLAKLPDRATDEMAAVATVLARPDRIIRGRARRRHSRAVSHRVVRKFLTPRGTQLRHAAEAATATVTAAWAAMLGAAQGNQPISSSGTPGDPEPSSGAFRALATRRGVLALAIVGFLTVVAHRSLIGTGRIAGGALLPAPAGASQLWRTYLESWHSVELGSAVPSGPYLAILAAVSTVLFGRPSLAVTSLVVGAVPLCWLSAYLVSRLLVRKRLLRIWGASAYALLPATTGAIAAGRIGTLAGSILLPPLGLAMFRALGRPPRGASWRAAWTAALLLAATTAFVPIAYPVVVTSYSLLLVPALSRWMGVALAWRRLAVVVGLPPLLLMPWSGELLRHPALLVAEAGSASPDLVASRHPPLGLILLGPGGPGTPPVWVMLGVLAAALAALVRSPHRRLVVVGWAMALIGLASAMLVSGADIGDSGAAWPGYSTVLAGAGMILAALMAGDGIRGRLSHVRFGWRQPVAVAVGLAAAAAPALAAGVWVFRGAAGPISRGPAVSVPAFIAVAANGPGQPRSLVLRMQTPGTLSFALYRGGGPRLGDGDVSTAARLGGDDGLAELSADVSSGRGRVDATALRQRAIRFVIVVAPIGADLVRVLDRTPGLQRAGAVTGARVWAVEGAPVSRASILSSGSTASPGISVSPGAVEEVIPVDTRPVGSHRSDAVLTVPPGPPGRRLVLAERYDDGWSATMSGNALVRSRESGAQSWAQSFILPTGAGTVTIRHAAAGRSRWLIAQLLVFLIAVVLATPGGRRRGDAQASA
jgi:GT2 family glycosyltransferase